MKLVLLFLSLAFMQKEPTASDAWALVSGDTAAVFATITNPSMYDVFVVSGNSQSSSAIEFMQGNKAVPSLTVPAFGSLELAPGVQRIQLTGLKTQLKEGDELTLTLETDGGVGIPIAAIVKAKNP